MLWHIVRFRFPPGVDDGDRQALEASLRSLAGRVPTLRFLRVARSLDEPHVTGLLTGFDDAAGLATYRDHPDHLPVASRAGELCREITRLDLVTDDPPDALPPTD
ncbi:MAG: Dabb family protein [Euzebyales bacterium]|nr:Dabb family protein [Euzebyales bacterium]MBA3621818.1 Dabb family protein [Euzebyales bacterium]